LVDGAVLGTATPAFCRRRCIPVAVAVVRLLVLVVLVLVVLLWSVGLLLVVVGIE